jgi:hypothetical protein
VKTGNGIENRDGDDGPGDVDACGSVDCGILGNCGSPKKRRTAKKDRMEICCGYDSYELDGRMGAQILWDVLELLVD